MASVAVEVEAVVARTGKESQQQTGHPLAQTAKVRGETAEAVAEVALGSVASPGAEDWAAWVAVAAVVAYGHVDRKDSSTVEAFEGFADQLSDFRSSCCQQLVVPVVAQVAAGSGHPLPIVGPAGREAHSAGMPVGVRLEAMAGCLGWADRL